MPELEEHGIRARPLSQRSEVIRMMNKRFFTTLGVTLSLSVASTVASSSVSQAQAEEPKPVQPAVPPLNRVQPPRQPRRRWQGPPMRGGRTDSQAEHAGLLPIIRHTLENGLRVVLSPDRTIPTVGIAVYYDVGSRNEVRGRSGFAHLFEHMMFQGSANVGKGEHFQLILNRGGEMNGTTSEDRTELLRDVALATSWSSACWLEADRMRSLAITQDNFENQRQTVMEERRQSYDNQPYAKSWLRINELAYQDYWPYAHSTIGDMKDLENAPLTAVQEFFNAYYAPNNAVLTLVGDFDPDEALALVKRHFGEHPSRGRPAYEPGALTPQTEERSEAMVDDLAQLPGFHVAYHIPRVAGTGHRAWSHKKLRGGLPPPQGSQAARLCFHRLAPWAGLWRLADLCLQGAFRALPLQLSQCEDPLTSPEAEGTAGHDGGDDPPERDPSGGNGEMDLWCLSRSRPPRASTDTDQVSENDDTFLTQAWPARHDQSRTNGHPCAEAAQGGTLVYCPEFARYWIKRGLMQATRDFSYYVKHSSTPDWRISTSLIEERSHFPARDAFESRRDFQRYADTLTARHAYRTASASGTEGCASGTIVSQAVKPAVRPEPPFGIARRFEEPPRVENAHFTGTSLALRHSHYADRYR